MLPYIYQVGAVLFTGFLLGAAMINADRVRGLIGWGLLFLTVCLAIWSFVTMYGNYGFGGGYLGFAFVGFTGALFSGVFGYIVSEYPRSKAAWGGLTSGTLIVIAMCVLSYFAK